MITVKVGERSIVLVTGVTSRAAGIVHCNAGNIPMREATPKDAMFALFVNPDNPNDQLKDCLGAWPSLATCLDVPAMSAYGP